MGWGVTVKPARMQSRQSWMHALAAIPLACRIPRVLSQAGNVESNAPSTLTPEHEPPASLDTSLAPKPNRSNTMALRVTTSVRKSCAAAPATRSSVPIVSVPTFAPLRPLLASKSPRRRGGIVAAEKESSSGKGGSSFDFEKLASEAQAKWDEIEDKPTLITYLVVGIVVLWVSSSVVNAFSGLPLVPKLLQLVGLVYTAWFVYRYLLFKSSRAELVEDIESLKKKITGGDD